MSGFMDFFKNIASGNDAGNGNMGLLQTGLGGLGMLGQLYQGHQAQKLSKEKFQFNKGMDQRNLANSAALVNDQKYKSALTRLTAMGVHDPIELQKAIATDNSRNDVSGTI